MDENEMRVAALERGLMGDQDAGTAAASRRRYEKAPHLHAIGAVRDFLGRHVGFPPDDL